MQYYLAESCQNTFIIIDCQSEASLSDALLIQAHKCLLKEKRDDALILFHRQSSGGAVILQMGVLGCDGLLGEFCGNGARAVAGYLCHFYATSFPVYLKTEQGLHLLSDCGEGLYSVHLPSARFALNPKFVHADFVKEYDLQYVEMLEPHLLLQKKISDEELLLLGAKLNARKDLFPLGINVNAWSSLGDDQLFVKTYERGAQRLTKSCGTGSVSCAAAFKKQHVYVTTPGGILEISATATGMTLKGPSSCRTKGKDL